MLARHLQDRLDVPRRIRVEVRAAADDRGAHLDGVPQHRQPVRAGHPGQHPRYRDRRQIGEPAQRPAGLEHRLERAQPLDVADADMAAGGGGAVAELEQRRLGRAALDLLGGVGGGSVGVRGQRGVAVGVRFGGGGKQEIAREVDAGALRGEAAGRPDRLDASAAQPHVHRPAVGQPGAAQDQCTGVRPGLPAGVRLAPFSRLRLLR